MIKTVIQHRPGAVQGAVEALIQEHGTRRAVHDAADLPAHLKRDIGLPLDPPRARFGHPML